jgi:hypothetical protein
MRTSLLLFSSIAIAALFAAAPAEAGSTALKDLMKKMGAAAAGGEAKALAPIFAQTATLAPKDSAFPNWKAISDKGKAAAETGDLAGAKATCKECHDAYKDSYKSKHGSKAP